MKAFITRDKRGIITAWKDNNERKLTMQGIWYNPDFRNAILATCIDEKLLPEGINPQWSDDEPIEINLKLERV